MMLLPQSGRENSKDILYHHIGEKLFEKRPLTKVTYSKIKLDSLTKL